MCHQLQADLYYFHIDLILFIYRDLIIYGLIHLLLGIRFSFIVILFSCFSSRLLFLRILCTRRFFRIILSGLGVLFLFSSMVTITFRKIMIYSKSGLAVRKIMSLRQIARDRMHVHRLHLDFYYY